MNKEQPRTPRARERRRVSPGAFESTLLHATEKLNPRLGLFRVCEALVEAVEDLAGSGSSSVLLYDEDSATLRAVFGRGPVHEIYREAVIPAASEIAGSVMASRRAIVVTDIRTPQEGVPSTTASDRDPLAALMLPLVAQDAAIGVLVFSSPYLSRSAPPRADDLARLSLVAAQLAAALAAAKMYEEAERDRRGLRALLEERRALRGRVRQLQAELSAGTPSREIVASSASLRQVLEQVRQAAPASVLLMGERGTGKEFLARAIHQQGARGKQPFVAVNCAALTASLAERELFGHDRGAFTGAIAPTAGTFELAHRGTLFLDEVGDLSLDAQAQLLRVLQEKAIVRVGGTHPIPVDVRVIAATNRDLRLAIGQRTFRADLYYRLTLFPIPPLRERRDDVLPLARAFLGYFASRMRKDVKDFEMEVAERLIAYDWPGNVRELQNVIERAVLLSSGPVLTADIVGSSPMSRQAF